MLTAFVNGLLGQDWCQTHPLAVTAIVSAASAIGKSAWECFNSDE